jgi:hypothetical protein
MQMLNKWRKSVKGQWSSIQEEWATECKHLTSAHKEWESKVKNIETNLSTAAAKFGAGPAVWQFCNISSKVRRCELGCELGWGWGIRML